MELPSVVPQWRGRNRWHRHIRCIQLRSSSIHLQSPRADFPLLNTRRLLLQPSISVFHSFCWSFSPLTCSHLFTYYHPQWFSQPTVENSVTTFPTVSLLGLPVNSWPKVIDEGSLSHPSFNQSVVCKTKYILTLQDMKTRHMDRHNLHNHNNWSLQVLDSNYTCQTGNLKCGIFSGDKVRTRKVRPSIWVPLQHTVIAP